MNENWFEYRPDGICISGWMIHWSRSAAVCNDGCCPAWPKESPDRIFAPAVIFSSWRLHQVSLKYCRNIFSGIPVSSRVWRKGIAVVRERRELEKAAVEEEEKRLQEAAMLLKHQQTPGPLTDKLILNLRISLRNLWRRLHKPLLQGCRKPVWADWGGEQVWPAQHERQPAQGAEEGPDEVGEGGQGLLGDAQEEQASASQAWPRTWSYHSPGNLDLLCFIARTFMNKLGAVHIWCQSISGVFRPPLPPSSAIA